MRLQRGRTVRPGLDHGRGPVAHQPWDRGLERLRAFGGALGVPLAPRLRRFDLLSELTVVERFWGGAPEESVLGTARRGRER
jgi:hypothetical protein